jgi:uncharacterized protein with von Willebrand factor type A (vWA) domain
MLNRSRPRYGADQDLVHRVDRWTAYSWTRFVEQHPSVNEELVRETVQFHGFTRWCQDVFARLFSMTPDRVEHPRPEDAWALRLNAVLDELPEVERLKRRCRGNRTLAGKAAVELAEEVLRRFPEPPAFEDPQPLRDEARGLSQLQALLSVDRSEADQAQGPTPSCTVVTSWAAQTQLDTQQLAEQLARVEAEKDRLVAEAQAYAQSLDEGVARPAARAASRSAMEAVDQLEAQASAFSGWGAGRASGMPLNGEALAELSGRLSDSEKLRKLAEEAGRMRRIALGKQKSKVDHGADEVSDVVRGADLARLLPTELGKLADPTRFLEFARGLTERSLAQYRLRGTDALGRGPLVVCIDESGSMEGPPELWAKALALGLLQVATMQRRHCRVVAFANQVARVRDWRPGEVDPIELTQSLLPFENGGTEFEPPLKAGLEAIEVEPTLKHADIIFITDGIAEITESFLEEWRAARKRLGFTTYAIHIATVGDEPAPILKELADQVLRLSDFNQDEHVTDAVLSL